MDEAAVNAQNALAEAMNTLAQTFRAQNGQAAARPAAPQLEAVKIPLYDGKTDVEDFIALFQHLADLYNWANNLRLAKLKTSLTGKAAECAAPNVEAEIFAALRARFGITAAEAKRSLLAMKPGHTDRLRDLADRIQKLTTLAYPEVNANVRATLALDQFKRCVSADLSVFMVSRPPATLDQAVQICSEYTSAASTTKGRKMQISSATVDPETESTCDSELEVNAFEHKALNKQDLQDTFKHFQDTMAECMKTMVATCAEAIKNEVQKSSSTSNSTPKNSWKPKPDSTSKPAAKNSQKSKPPPGPCTCGELHWYADCPNKSQKAKNNKPSKQEN
jgi:hypothetical protein